MLRILRRYSCFLLVFLMLCAKFRFRLILRNESDILPFIKHYADSSWIRNDWYLNQNSIYRASFDFLLQPLFVLFSLPTATLLGRLFSYAVFAFGIDRLCSVLRLRTRFALFFVLFHLSYPTLGAGEWMVGGLETKVFSYSCILLGLTEALRGKFRTTSVLMGLATAFHVLVGGYASAALLLAYFITRKSRSLRIKEFIICSVIFSVASLPAGLAVFSFSFERKQSEQHADILNLCRISQS